MEQIMIKVARDIVHAYQAGELPPDFTLSDFRDLEYLFWCYNNKRNYYGANERLSKYAIDKGIKVTERYGIYRFELGGENDAED